MAAATFNFTPSVRISPGGSRSQKVVTYYGTITFSAAGDTYATNGIPVGTGTLAAMGPYANTVPERVDVWSARGTGWSYQYNTATAKLVIFTGNSSGSGTQGAVELTNTTALNATTPTISTDVVRFEAIFPYGSLTGL